MTGRRRRMALSIGTLESRELLSGLTPALNTTAGAVVLSKGTAALHEAAMHDSGHTGVRPGAIVSEARAQHPLGQTHGDAYLNVLSGHVYSGSASNGTVPVPTPSFFSGNNFTVGGLNSDSNTTKSVNINPGTTPIGNQSQVTVSVKPQPLGANQVLDLWFQTKPIGPLGVDNTKGRKNSDKSLIQELTVGKISGVHLDVNPRQAFDVRFFFYFTTGNNSPVAGNAVSRYGRKIEVGNNPLDSSQKVYFVSDKIVNDKQSILRITNSTDKAKPVPIVWPNASGASFFLLSDYAVDLAKNLGITTSSNAVNGIHFDVQVTPVPSGK